MLNIVKQFFGKIANADSDAETSTSHDLRVATCALLLEMARIDEKFTDAEINEILSILKERYGLSQEHADALIEEADRALKESVDTWHFARLINENYTTEEKIEIVETLWRVIFVDGKMDAHENYLVHKLSNLLRLQHNQLIDAKLKVLGSAG